MPASFAVDTTLAKGCYVAKISPELLGTGTLRLSAGVEIRFSEGTGLTFVHGQALLALGSESDPVTLTAEVPVRGYWRGVAFDQATPLSSRLDHVTIEYAGAPTAGGSLDWSPAGLASVNTTLTVDHCTIRESAGYGFYFDPYGQVLSFTNNVVTENVETGVTSLQPTSRGIDPTSHYSGNDVDRVTLAINSGGDISLPILDVPYFVRSILYLSGRLSLAPGVTFIFGSGAGIELSSGALQAAGTVDRPIVFTAEQPVPGFWAGLRFSSIQLSSLSRVVVEYGGGRGPNAANIQVLGPLTLVDSVVRHSAGLGLWLGPNERVNSDYASANGFSDNAAGDF